MDKLQREFEATLKSKLSQKTNKTQSEETILARNLQYFDSDNDGIISMNEWFKAIEKVGVILPSVENLKALFEIYDVNGNGELDYKEFAHTIYSSKKFE